MEHFFRQGNYLIIRKKPVEVKSKEESNTVNSTLTDIYRKQTLT